MFTLSVRKLFRNTFGSWQSATPPRRKPRVTFRPRLEVLEERWCPATNNVWESTGNENWAVGTNWSLQHSPQAGETAVFGGTGGTNTSCYIPAGENLPTIAGLTMKNYTGTLTLQSNLAANVVNISPRTGIQPGQSEIIINSGSDLYALQTLNWTGGNVSGSGTFEVAGTDTISGTSSTDKPTLGTAMFVGLIFNNELYTGTLTFSATSQPLVVVQNADIWVQEGGTLQFNNKPLSGQTTATAISNGDTSAHAIIVNGGTLTRTNVCELFVATGLEVDSGEVLVKNPEGQTSGNPLHFTKTVDGFGPGLEVSGGEVLLGGDLTSDNYGTFEGGTVHAYAQSTVTLGVNANSYASTLTGGTFLLEGKLVAHGGFSMYSGTFGTDASDTSVVQLDTGNSFYLTGGVLDITETGSLPLAQGKLEIKGDFSADGGDIVDAVNSSRGTNGVLQVDGNATLSDSTTFITYDLGNPPPNFTKNWNLMTVGGTRSGNFFYNFPTIKWTADWSGGTLVIQENT